ncbi:MAG: hypothetical protein HZB16_13200 [Armatimonadetes bacterium]|nr:hypothetical protein [Armatimonadota bacterium]
MSKHRTSWLVLGLALLGRAGWAAEDPLLAEARKAPPISGVFTPYASAFEVSGNAAQAGRYLAPHAEVGFSVDDLSLRAADGFDALDLWAHGAFGYNQRNLLQVWTHEIPARLRVNYGRSLFVSEPTLLGQPLGSRSSVSYDLLVRPATWAAVSGGYRNDNDRLGLLARGGTIMNRGTEAWGALNIDTGMGVLGGYFSTSDYRDRAVGQPSSSTLQYGVNYDGVFGKQWALAGGARWAEIRIPGAPKSTVFLAGVSGSYQASSNLSFDARWRYRDVVWGPTQNAYLGRSNGGGASLTYRPWKPMTVRAGFEISELQRFNATQTALEKPGETRFWVRADYRGGRSLKASASYQLRSLSRLAVSAVPGITNTAPLFADSDQRVDLRASRMIGGSGLGYAFYQYRQIHSDTRAIDSAVGTVGVGLTMPLSHSLTGTTDWYYRYATDSQLSMAGLGTDTVVAHVGLGWQPGPRWHMTADYHWVNSYYGQAASDHYIAATLGYDAGKNSTFQLSYSRDGYDGGLFPGLDYDADIFRFSLVNKF